MIQSTVKVVLVDDDEMVRQGIQLLLERDGFSVVGFTSNGYDALSLIEQLKPHVVLLDINLPQLNGIEVAIQVRREHPQVGLIMLTAHRQHDEVVRSLQVGVKGYVWKGSDYSELTIAIRAILRGQSFISPAVSNAILSEYLNGTHERETGTRELLTPRQRQVLQLIAEGHSNKDIASVLGLSVNTRCRCASTRRASTRSSASC